MFRFMVSIRLLVIYPSSVSFWWDGKRKGGFGVTFAIEGSTAKPTVIVNPVSLLTPGVFRQIFDFNNSIKNRRFEKLPKKKKRRRQKTSFPPPY